MANFVYVDNSNVWIEGKHVSAVVKGLALDLWDACKMNICDNAWVLDFGFLFDFTVGTPKEKGRAVLYGSKPPQNDSLWNAARAQSWEVVLHERNIKNREKRIDVHIATDIACDSYDLMKPGQDTITLVAGDGDYLPTIERIRNRGFQFDVIFWDHASGDLKAAASSFTSLNRWLNELCHK